MLGALGPVAIALPAVPSASCPVGGPLATVCGAVGGLGSSIAGAGADAVLQAVSTWVVQSAGWLLGQLGGAIEATTSVDVGAGWFTAHYQVMAGIAGVVVLPLLVASVLQALYRQSAAILLRAALVHLPLAMLLTGVAVQLVQLALAVTDALSTTVASGTGSDISVALSGVANALSAEATAGDGAPAFVVLLAALLVVLGAIALWLELLVRSAAVYVAVLFLPLALASIVWPAVSHWCRRLVDTLVALVLSKFVIVAVLSLAAGALASGTNSGSFAAALAGAALLLLAAFTPFTLLRLVPLIEAGAVHHLEGARHRVQHTVTGPPQSAATYALRRLRETPLPPAVPGTGAVSALEAPGAESEGISAEPAPGVPVDAGRRRAEPAAADGLVGTGASIPAWRGIPVTAGDRARSTTGVTRRVGGGPPVWGRPPDPSGEPPPGAAPGPGDPGGHVVAHDAMGPVIRWLPPGRAPASPPGPAGPTQAAGQAPEGIGG